MKVTFLGTGTSVGVPAIGCDCSVCTSDIPANNRTRTSVLLRLPAHNVLIDASIDLRQQALREKITSLEAVLLTHAHADHVFGLDDLRMFNFRQKRSMPIFSSRAILSDVRRTFWYVFVDGPIVSSRPQLTLEDIEAPFMLQGTRIEPFTVGHGTVHIVGYRIGRFAYITDGKTIPDASLAKLENLDVLVINALRREPHPTHFNLEEALAMIHRISPRKAYLTHISHDLDHVGLMHELPPHIQPAYDGLTIDVEHSR